MKKSLLFISAVISLFVGVSSVNASSYYLADNCTNMENGMGKTCNTKLVVEDGTVKINEIDLTFTMIGITFETKNVSLNSNWKIKDSSATSLNIESNKSSYAVGTYDIGTLNFYKIASASVCNVIYSYRGIYNNRECSVLNGNYYDKAGELTTQLNYQKQCLPNICTILSDGTYYNKEGNVSTKEEYENQCLEKKYCVYDNGKYYDKDGNETTEANYKRICEKNYCKVITDGDNKYYFDKDGVEATKEKYESDCIEKIICSISDNKYYGTDGKEISKLEYLKTCSKNICTTLEDGTKYDKNGKVTTDINYQKECEINVCKKLSDGTLYGKSGQVVDEKTYDLECNKHKCQVIDNNYFDDKGNLTTKENYTKACENPKTGESMPYIVIALGLSIAGAIFYIIKTNNKLRKI